MSVQRGLVASPSSHLLRRLLESSWQHQWSRTGPTPHLPPSPRQLQTVRPVAFGPLGVGFAFKPCPLPSAEPSGIKKRLFLLGGEVIDEEEHSKTNWKQMGLHVKKTTNLLFGFCHPESSTATVHVPSCEEFMLQPRCWKGGARSRSTLPHRCSPQSGHEAKKTFAWGAQSIPWGSVWDTP